MPRSRACAPRRGCRPAGRRPSAGGRRSRAARGCRRPSCSRRRPSPPRRATCRRRSPGRRGRRARSRRAGRPRRSARTRAAWPCSSCRCRASRRTGRRDGPCRARSRCAACARCAPDRPPRRRCEVDGGGRARARAPDASRATGGSFRAMSAGAATAPARGAGSPREPPRGAVGLASAFAAAGIAVVVYLAFGGHAFLNYDSSYTLAWGADLAAGRTPQYGLPVAPTPHPVAIAVGILLAPLGDAAEGVFLALVLLAIGALAVGVFRLGARLYAWPVGLVAGAIVLTRQPILNYGIRGYVDLPAIALVVWAAVLEARRPRRGAPVLVLLAIAGLLRPEAWLFAAVYWLWTAPALGWAGRARLAALAISAPVVWAVSDLLVTGDPFWSLHGTSSLAAELERPTGLHALPTVVPYRLGEILRLPELVGAVLGFAAGLAWFRRRTLLPTAIALLNVVACTAFAIAGLPLLGRYLFLAACMLALFTGLAALGFTALPEDSGTVRLGGAAVGLTVLAALVLFFPIQLGRL